MREGGCTVKERRIQIVAAATGFVGLLLVWYLVNDLSARGWSMDIIHFLAVFGASLVTLAASLIVVVIVTRYRKILEGKNRQLERLAGVGATVAGLAHYQKNLLNGLRGGLYITDGGVETGDVERIREGWHMLSSTVLRIERLTMDMLYYVRQRSINPEPTDINQVIQEAITLMRENAADRGVVLHAELDSSIPLQLLDRTAIYRSLLNIVSNAIDACTEAGTGGLVTLKSRMTSDEITVTVEDDGVGMTDEVLSNLFAHFYSTKGGRGTGLGLVVVKEVLEQHGASVEVESEPGCGSAFRLRFPIASVTSKKRSPASNIKAKGEQDVGQEGRTYSRGPGRNQPIHVMHS
jgi:signal transduction histidine kinase